MNLSVLACLGALLAVLFHRIRTTSAAYHFRLPLSTSGSALVHVSKRLWVRVPQVELNFLLSSFFPFYLLSFLYLFLSLLYPFLCTSLHSALSGVESGVSCATTEGPAH